MRNSIEIKSFELKELLSFIKNKEVSIPEFQRGFVWNTKQIRTLFESLVKRYPIGSFIIWKTTERIGQRNLFIKNPSSSRKKYFILDGQQRLLTIFYLCNQNIFEEVKDEFEEIFEDKQKKLINFQYFYFDDKKKPKLSYSEEKVNKFDYQKFKQLLGRHYKFPLIFIHHDDYRTAQEIFERINQGGTRIGAEAIFLSEIWNKQSELGKKLRNWKKENKSNLSGKIDNIIFIHALSIIIQLEKLIGEDNPHKPLCNPESVDIGLTKLKRIAEKIRDEHTQIYEKEFKILLSATNLAMTFLNKQFKIRRLNEIPSQTMITLLIIFFYYCDDPTGTQRKELRKWFWISSLSSRYVGSDYNKNIREDPLRIKKLAKYSHKLNLRKAELNFYDLFNTDIKTGRSTIRNAIKLLLWIKQPKFINGEELNRDEIETRKKKKEEDHFYPYNFYAKYNLLEENEVNTLLNLVFLTKEENAKKQDVLPSVWLNKRKNELKSNYDDESGFFKTSLLPFECVSDLRSEENHLLNNNNSVKRLLFKKYYQKFLKKRYKILEKELRRLQRGD